MNDRLRLLRSYLKGKKADGILLTSPLSIHYYTAFYGFSIEEREGFALVTPTHVHLLTSKLYEGAVKSLANVTLSIYSSEQPFLPLLNNLLAKNNLKTLGVEANNLTLAEYIEFKKLAKIIPLKIRHLRIKKTTGEVEKIKKACQIADRAFEKIVTKIKSGMTEKEVALLLENEIQNQGATTSFRSIVAFAENAAIPHHITSDKQLKTNDIILMDFGAKVDGYCSDMTRTFFVGKPSEEQKKVYNVVSKAQQAAINYLNQELRIESHELKTKNKALTSTSKTIKASDADSVSRKYIESQGYPTIPHSVGHGIGLEVHEPPYVGPGSNDMLEEGMVFSIEPGIYLPGQYGVRIEDLFTIQNNKLMLLTHGSLQQ